MGSPCECLSCICRMGIIRKGSGKAREFAPKAVHMNRSPTPAPYKKSNTSREKHRGNNASLYVHIDFSLIVSKIIKSRRVLKKDLASIEFGLNIESEFINNRSVNVWNVRFCKAACNRNCSYREWNNINRTDFTFNVYTCIYLIHTIRNNQFKHYIIKTL